MTVLKILQFPQDEKRLRTKAKFVEVFDDALQSTIDDMFETHYAQQNCAGLAATQLDIQNPPHITVIDFSPNKDQPLCLVNIEILEKEGSVEEPEGCMSVGGDTYEVVNRATKVKVRANDRHGKALLFEAEGFMAKAIQHELDHLEGKLFIDYLSKLKYNRIKKKIIKYQKE